MSCEQCLDDHPTNKYLSSQKVQKVHQWLKQRELTQNIFPEVVRISIVITRVKNQVVAWLSTHLKNLRTSKRVNLHHGSQADH